MPPRRVRDHDVTEAQPAALLLSRSGGGGQLLGHWTAGRADGATHQRQDLGHPQQRGRWTVTVTASNATGGVARASFPWTVVKAGDASAARLAREASRALGAHRLRDRWGRVGVQLRLRVKARSVRSTRLAYTATGLPAGLGIDRHTGVISGRPRTPGSRTVRVRVTDGRGHAITISFRWTIQPARVVA
jgi:hypothetical protein